MVDYGHLVQKALELKNRVDTLEERKSQISKSLGLLANLIAFNWCGFVWDNGSIVDHEEKNTGMKYPSLEAMHILFKDALKLRNDLDNFKEEIKRTDPTLSKIILVPHFSYTILDSN